jgi:hypothetical protein
MFNQINLLKFDTKYPFIKNQIMMKYPCPPAGGSPQPNPPAGGWVFQMTFKKQILYT